MPAPTPHPRSHRCIHPESCPRRNRSRRIWQRKTAELYPKLICCDISGYGDSGEYRKMKAYDLLVQCESGMASITGTPDAPGRVGVSACDINCGQQAYSAILEALIERENSNKGCTIKVSLFDSMAEWMAVPLLHYDYAGTVQNELASACHHLPLWRLHLRRWSSYRYRHPKRT